MLWILEPQDEVLADQLLYGHEFYRTPGLSFLLVGRAVKHLSIGYSPTRSDSIAPIPLMEFLARSINSHWTEGGNLRSVEDIEPIFVPEFCKFSQLKKKHSLGEEKLQACLSSLLNQELFAVCLGKNGGTTSA